MRTINIVSDFSEYPGLRHCSISENSGEQFYHSILNKEFKAAYEAGEKLTVNLDSTAGYASSFLDEAFGNLVYDFTVANVLKAIQIISEDEPEWKAMIQEQTFPQWEQRRRNKEEPKVTDNHSPWYRLVGTNIENNVWEKP